MRDSDADLRESMQTLVGMHEILLAELDRPAKLDFQRFVQAEEELVRIRLVRIEEQINMLRVLVAALGAAIMGIGGALAVLAD